MRTALLTSSSRPCAIAEKHRELWIRWGLYLVDDLRHTGKPEHQWPKDTAIAKLDRLRRPPGRGLLGCYDEQRGQRVR
jgi:hypothetical protein